MTDDGLELRKCHPGSWRLIAALETVVTGLTAFDAVIHMVEEMPSPRRDAPKAMYLAVICGAASGFIFMLATLFSIQDFDMVLNTPTGFPFIQVLEDALGRTAGTVLVALFIVNGFGQGISVMTSASRLTWGFARDGGLPWGSYFSHVDPTWKVPARALWLQCFIVCLIGVLYTFASTVLEAVLAVSTIALTISSPNPSATDMNYAIAVFGVMLLVSFLFWVARGRVTYLRTQGSAERDVQARRWEMESYDGLAVAESHALATKSSHVGLAKACD
ncbi:hypothetical protein VdG1_05644 [Verticillium dahliae VDG1]|nr:hypothetical protein VdG1_05644 [Verticillium dahliae VDG1]